MKAVRQGAVGFAALALAACASPQPVESHHAESSAPMSHVAASPASSAVIASAIPSASSVAVTPPPKDADPAPLRPFTLWDADPSILGAFRDKGARERRTEVVKQLFSDAGVAFPATEMLFRVFKKEGKLEVWANDEKGAPLKPIATYGICRISGDIGPKRHEGDRQVPEGFYTIPHIETATSYHLAMAVSYPNPYDEAESRYDPGGQILVHGSCVSIGCISMSDERIEELWTMAAPLYKAHHQIALHIFPTRAMKELLADPDQADHASFWRMIEPTWEKFESDHLLPTVTFNVKHEYVVNGTALAPE